MQIKKPVKLSLPKQITLEIEKAIKNGIFKVGERIPSEPDLVKKFAVSRNTIREAIQSLIQAGVLESRQGNGTYVLTNDRFEANILTRLSNSKIQEVHEVRSSLEKEIVKLAAQRRTQSDLEEIKKALDEININKGSFEENSEADLKFHLAIAKASHNSIFYDLYKSISQYICFSVAKRLELTLIEEKLISQLHIELYEAIFSQDVKKAEETINKILKI
ncbi:transcriptional regulator [Halarcobacter mediterraneus]|uniref:Transcriptional regulator n=1 Tax=Halarcobacter mediterraneus TaxID=2023153 RepID=A0A4Q1AWJ8_9BACT|nr:FadR/GntR family transcriptional regulator [Halarcobacter mediterraneus]RXK14098.1 transcriptional regulator [Halarcobacter mediterraneus]